MQKRLYRSRKERLIWGVCGGLAEYFNVDPTIIRLIAVLLVISGGVGIPAYIILAIIMPLESTQASEPKEVIMENVEEMARTASQLGETIRSSFAGEEKQTGEASAAAQHARNILGIILVILGVLFLLWSLSIFSWLTWGVLLSAVLIVIGLLILFGGRRK